jgi:hypothetical protein
MRSKIFFCFLIILAAILVYANSFTNEFIWDDKAIVVENNYIKDFSYFNKLFTAQAYEGSGRQSSFYRPLQNLTYMVDYALWGLVSLGYHLTNTLIHSINGILVFLLVFALVKVFKGSEYKGGMPAFLAALLFLIHPIHTEAVTYISGRADILAVLFMLLTFLFYTNSKFYVWGLIGALAFIFSLFSKESSLILPIFLLGYDLIIRKKFSIVRLSPYLLVAVFYIIFRMTLVRFDPSTTEFSALGLMPRLLTTAKAFPRYLALFIWPVGLHMERTLPIVKNIMNVEVIFSLLTIVFVVWLGGYLRKKEGGLISFGIFWFLAGLLPVSNIFPINAFMAEHWLYFPSIGIFLIVGLVLNKLYINKRWRSAAGVVFIVIIILGTLTMKRNRVWRDGITFFRDTLKYNPNSYKLHNQLGIAYMEKNMMKDAVVEFQEALRIKQNPHTYNDLGVLYLKMGKLEQAIIEFQNAISQENDFFSAYTNIGSVYYTMGNLPEARKWFEESLEIRPDSAAGHNNLGVIYMELGQTQQALAEFQEALRLDPDIAEAKVNIDKLKK